MKVTHRQPIELWYDVANYTHLDYPPLSAYLHYGMSYVYRYIDERSLLALPLYGYGELTPLIMKGLRVSILALSVLTYYPPVIYVVFTRFRKYSKIHRVVVLLLLLNFPTYALVEFANTQANSPHLGLLILALHFLLDEHLILTTITFSLSLTCKHIGGPLVFPIAVYMLAKCWERNSRTVKTVPHSVTSIDDGTSPLDRGGLL